jgi:hypothetical protein
MLVAEYAKIFSRTVTQPFLPTCHARADLGSANPCVMCAICSPLAPWRLPSGAISRIIIYLVAQAKVFFCSQDCGNWQSSAHLRPILCKSFPTTTATASRSPSTKSRGASGRCNHMLTVTRNWPSGMRRQWPTYLPRSTSRVPGLMGTCTL